MRYVLAGIACAALVCGCAQQKDPSIEAVRAYVREVTHDDVAASAGGLRVTANDVTTDGRIAKVRGRVENRYTETVHGIRYVVTLYEYGTALRVVDRWQHEVDTTLEPGQRCALSLDVESMYFGRSGRSPFIIDAQPVKLGSRDMPPPEGWR
jgi:hypothetical protein